MSKRAASQQAQHAVQGTDVARGCALRRGRAVLAVELVGRRSFASTTKAVACGPERRPRRSATRPPGGNAAGRHETAAHWPMGECAFRRGRR